MTIHWVGTGLTSVPGLRRLLSGRVPVTVWNRTVDKARGAVGNLAADIREYGLPALADAVGPGDVVVSLLPADRHVALARVCLDRRAHFVCPSLISRDMAALEQAAVDAGVALVNEVGLNPGIDQLVAHDLVNDYRHVAQPGDTVRFTSYCGGIPKHPNRFRYKVSCSPLEVLQALRAPARVIREGAAQVIDPPWQATRSYDAPLPTPERFEVHPTGDSTVFTDHYGFDPAWHIHEFVHGTIRLKGWREAWAPVLAELAALHGPEGDARLRQMADRFRTDHAYAPGEPDRVVLCVALHASRNGAPVFGKEWVLDAQGGPAGTAMAQLVSVPVAMAAEAVLAGHFAPGVHAAPRDPLLVGLWLVEVGQIASHMAKVDHLRVA